MSIDGLGMWRQAIAVTYHHSWTLVPPIWWGSVITSSSRGIGASLEYVPSLLVFPWLSGHIPVVAGAQYDYRLFYGDILYIVAGAPVWAVVTAFTAYLAALITRAMGFDRREALWATAFYGLGSPALMASRGDWPQPLVATCWAIGVYACLQYRAANSRRWLWVSGASIAYGVNIRPLEGSLLLPAVVLLLALPDWRNRVFAVGSQAVAWAAGVAATLFLDQLRFGSPFNFGYPTSALAWTTPLWQGVPNGLISPGRGFLWEFPALVLAVLGARYLWKVGRRLEATVLIGLPAFLFIEACSYFGWVGGWDWGLRFMQPALPLLAVAAAIGSSRLPRILKPWLPAGVVMMGIAWNVPAVTTDILGGYGAAYADSASNWRLDAYPPIGAWRFLKHVFPTSGTDGSSIDIVWFRATRLAGKVALVPFVFLLGAAGFLWASAVRLSGEQPATSDGTGASA